jgi:hypothetical protein
MTQYPIRLSPSQSGLTCGVSILPSDAKMLAKNVIHLGVGGPQLMGYPEQEVKKVLLLSQCIASDDPRLKEAK